MVAPKPRLNVFFDGQRRLNHIDLLDDVFASGWPHDPATVGTGIELMPVKTRDLLVGKPIASLQGMPRLAADTTRLTVGSSVRFRLDDVRGGRLRGSRGILQCRCQLLTQASKFGFERGDSRRQFLTTRTRFR